MKKALSIFLIITVLLSCVPINVFAQASTTNTTITVEDAFANIGNTVKVNVMISNNPGIAGATLSIGYDENLVLVGAESGNAFFGLDFSGNDVETFANPSKFSWDSENKEVTADGVILKLTFRVSEQAKYNSKLGVNVSYRHGDVYNDDGDITLEFTDGYITVVDYMPGDLFEDGIINTKDVRIIRQLINGNCSVEVKEVAADVNADGVVNTKDTRLLRRYINGGYGVKLLPGIPKCTHSMKSYPAVSKTCTKAGNIAYWECSLCNKYFKDANGTTSIDLEDTVIPAGHRLTYVEAKAATSSTEGCIEHWLCSACGKYYGDSTGNQELNKDDVIISKLERKETTVVYNVYGSDPYLESVGVDNSVNPSNFDSEDGLVLNDIIAPAGYVFNGWTTASGTPVSEIAPSTASRQIVLNANWSKTTYRITFDTPDVSVSGNKITGESVTNYTEYTVDTGVTLNDAKCYGYTFVGWSNDDGFLVKSIKPGTTGNMTLHANWTSNRNRATSYSDYGEPIIIEDDKNGQFLFVYDIGRIDNVPLYTYIDEATNTAIGANGTALNIDMQYEVKEEFNETEAKEVIETVADATTRSSGWTLSEEWNDIYQEGSEYSDKQVKTEERVDSQGNIVGGNYFVSNSQGGSSFVSTESGGSSSNSSKVTTDRSYGINSSYDASTEKYCDAKLGVTNETELSAGVEVPVKIAKVSAGVKNTTTVNAEVANGRKDNEAFHVDQSASSYIGTVDTSTSSSYYNTVANQSSNWNSNTGYEKSYQTSVDTSVRNAISNEIAKTTTHNISKALGGANSKNETVSGTTSSEKGYSNSIKVSEYHSKTTTKHVKYTNPEIGYYRVVMAGTVHVYGVVGYDVATASYYTYTYNVLADDTFEYVDYSKERATFDDCENGVVTFEIPYEVNEYVLGVTSETDGLEIGLDGTVNKFETPVKLPDKASATDANSTAVLGEEEKVFDGTVVVPQYHAETQPGTDNIAIKTKAISSTAFKNNKDIKTVILPIYITEIPDNAFEGCTNLETVIAYGVTKIGDNAFKDCNSLKKFYVDNYITELGTNAFENVPEIAVMAHDSAVADAAIASGAKRITVDISKITDSYNNKTVVVDGTTDYFGIVGNGGEYKNLRIESSAGETLISKIKFVNNTDTPMEISSPVVTLSVVSVVDSPVYALHLKENTTSSQIQELKLYGEINLSSISDNTVISKSVILSKANKNITSKLNLSGNYLVCGEVVNKEEFLNVEPTSITADEYNIYVSPCAVTFNVNGGSVSQASTYVYYGQTYGTLPTPTRSHYTFNGWYTAATGGTKVTSETTVNVKGNQILYAQWTAVKYTLTLNANGGSVSPASISVSYGAEYGTLPTPTRNHYTFNGWYTAASGGTKVTNTTKMGGGNVTIYAQWTQKPEKGWVKATEVPAGAKITQTKWTYTLREYTTSSASTLSGWIKYKTERTGWGPTQGPVYYDPSNGVRNVWSEQYVVSSNYKTVYHYFRYAVNKTGGYGSYAQSSSYPTYYAYDFDSPLEANGTNGGYNRFKYWYSSSNYISVYACSPYTTQEWVSDNYGTRWYYQEPVYTYYYYRDVDKEATSDPTGKSNVSNVVKWVKYIEK